MAQPLFNPYSSRLKTSSSATHLREDRLKGASFSNLPVPTGPASPKKQDMTNEAVDKSTKKTGKGANFFNLSIDTEPTKKSNIMGGLSGLLNKLKIKSPLASDSLRGLSQASQPDLNKPPPLSAERNYIIHMPTPSSSKLSITSSAINMTTEGDQTKREFVGKFTTEALFKKISSNLQSNKALEEMISSKKNAGGKDKDMLKSTDRLAIKRLANMQNVEQRIADPEPKLTNVQIERRLEKSLGRSRSKQKLRPGETPSLCQTYYMKTLKYYLDLKQKPPIGKLYCEHFLQSIAAIKYTQTLRPVSDEAIYKSQVNCAQLNDELRKSKETHDPL